MRPIDWRTLARAHALRNTLPVYSPPWSLWKITPVTSPPRTAIATCNAAVARGASWWAPMANPTARRECRSNTVAILWN